MLNDEQRAERIAELRMAKAELIQLIRECPHRQTKRVYGSSVQCAICGTELGWWCPESPNHVCQYDDAEDPVHDFCLHCGNPEERK